MFLWTNLFTFSKAKTNKQKNKNLKIFKTFWGEEMRSWSYGVCYQSCYWIRKPKYSSALLRENSLILGQASHLLTGLTVWQQPCGMCFFFFFFFIKCPIKASDKVIASLWGPILWCLLKHSSQQIGLQVIFSGMSLSPSLSQMTWGLSYMVLSRANRTKMRHRLHTRVCTPQRVAELFGSSWQLERGHQHP